MTGLVMAGWLALGALFGASADREPSPPAPSAIPVVVEVRVNDPELAQMARDLEREVFPLLPRGAAVITQR